MLYKYLLLFRVVAVVEKEEEKYNKAFGKRKLVNKIPVEVQFRC